MYAAPESFTISRSFFSADPVADPGVVPRVPGHHPKIQGYTTKLLTSHRSSQLLQESLHT